MKLTAQQIQDYRTRGFVAPVRGFDEAQIAHYRAAFERFEQEHGGIVGTPFQFRPHLHQPWAQELVRRPEILDAVESLIGPDILVYHFTIWVKEPAAPSYISWHQDSTYFGLEPFEHVTAWVAVSDATQAMGCMRMIPGSHHRGELPLTEVRADGALMLRAGQVIEVDEAAEEVEAVPLRKGEFSLHHTLTLHASGPNASSERRIGFGISYIPAGCRCTASQRVNATLVRGCDDYGHFDLEPSPDPDDLGPGFEQHRRSLERWNKMREQTRSRVLQQMDR